MTFIERLDTLCKEKNISKRKLEREAGLGTASTTKWKKEGSVPNQSSLEKLSEYFGSDYVNDVVNALKNVETSTSNESEKSKAAALKDLGKLSVLNSSSTYKLLSAIYRFFQTRDNDKSTFFQNLFNIGINNVPLNKTTKTTQNGLSIVFNK